MRRSPLPVRLGTSALLAVSACAGTPPPVLPPSAECCTATIRVMVPEGTGTVYLAGSLPELGPWRPDGQVMTGEGRRRTVRVTAPRGTTFEYMAVPARGSADFPVRPALRRLAQGDQPILIHSSSTP